MKYPPKRTLPIKNKIAIVLCNINDYGCRRASYLLQISKYKISPMKKRPEESSAVCAGALFGTITTMIPMIDCPFLFFGDRGNTNTSNRYDGNQNNCTKYRTKKRWHITFLSRAMRDWTKKNYMGNYCIKYTA